MQVRRIEMMLLFIIMYCSCQRSVRFDQHLLENDITYVNEWVLMGPFSTPADTAGKGAALFSQDMTACGIDASRFKLDDLEKIETGISIQRISRTDPRLDCFDFVPHPSDTLLSHFYLTRDERVFAFTFFNELRKQGKGAD